MAMETTANTPAIDWALCVELASGEERLAKDLLRMLARDLPEARDAISTARVSNDLLELRRQAHKLQGVACYCGIPTIKSTCISLQQAIRDDDQRGISSLSGLLVNAINDVLTQYEAEYAPLTTAEK